MHAMFRLLDSQFWRLGFALMAMLLIGLFASLNQFHFNDDEQFPVALQTIGSPREDLSMLAPTVIPHSQPYWERSKRHIKYLIALYSNFNDGSVQRKLLRRTWLADLRRQHNNSDAGDLDIAYVFLIFDTNHEETHEIVYICDHERRLYGDMVLLSTVVRNVSESRQQTSLRYLHRLFNFDWLILANDNVVINIDMLRNQAQNWSKVHFFAGDLIANAAVNKHYEPQLKLTTYPKHTASLTVLSYDLVQWVANQKTLLSLNRMAAQLAVWFTAVPGVKATQLSTIVSAQKKLTAVVSQPRQFLFITDVSLAQNDFWIIWKRLQKSTNSTRTTTALPMK
jgi:hypothetical protein